MPSKQAKLPGLDRIVLHFSSRVDCNVEHRASLALSKKKRVKINIHQELSHITPLKIGWRQDNGKRPNQESKFDFLATRQRQVKIDEGQQKIKIVRTNRQSNLQASCQSIFSLGRHHPKN